MKTITDYLISERNHSNDQIQQYIDLLKLEGLKDKTIVLKKNNIKNQLENYDYLSYVLELEKGKDKRTDFGSDLFNLDIDYNQFFKINKINQIIFENCLFSNYINKKVDQKNNTLTIINLVKDLNNYIFDMKSLNEIIYRNKSIPDITFLLKYFSLNHPKMSEDIYEYLCILEQFFNNLNYIFKAFVKYLNEKMTIIFKDIKERKEFYCLLCIIKVLIIFNKEENKNDKSLKKVYTYDNNKEKPKIELPNSELLQKDIKDYFLKEKNENDEEICSIFNYYYESEEEKNMFGEWKDGTEKEIDFEKLKFKIKYKNENPWNIIYT